jgi:3-oxoacyl-[acyl-carrier protein] reductase
MSHLKNKVAVVTGASKGIGAGIAKALGEAGASVVVNYASSREGAVLVVDEIVKAGGTAAAVHADVSKSSDVERLFAETRKLYGRLDILVNNAAIYEFAPLEQITEEHFHRQFNINVLGVVLASREAVKHFGPEGGNIVNISSTASRLTPASTAVYSGTKGALDAITGVLAKELGPKGIRVNSINPGPVETEGFQALGIGESDWIQQLRAQTPLGRIAQPADIAPIAVFLASQDSGWLTGETLLASGGLR